MTKLDEQTINTFKTQGVVKLNGVFTDWVEELQAGVEENMTNPGPFHREYLQQDEGGRFFGDYCNWSRISQYHNFVFNSPCAAIARQLMTSKQSRFFHEHVLVKEPGTGKSTPWHHDQPYYCVDGKQVVSFWIPLDPVPESTCPEFIAGSHLWNKWFIPTKFSGVEYDHSDPDLDHLPDIDANREQYDIRNWSLQPGDAIAFHFLTVHGAPANLSSEHRRRGFAARWVGDDAVYAQRSGDISPPFPGLEDKLVPGGQLETEEFPLVTS
ncbi:MAG: ectoine hydroxylase-related dioxygenase (phytanoyl-CoA dioxygenase family) [Parasphingorhabdus sp.]|jgi:ectoine hydroxylase-related dioxygenase (phytanoyl-CoA dioxygenase family)